MLELKAVILGLVEGFTEFLPISSTAHLIIMASWLRLPSNEYWKFFEVFIQTGAILAVVTLYFKQLFNRKIIVNLISSFIPTAIVGLVFYKIIKTYFFESELLISFSLIFLGMGFLIIERLIKNNKIKLNKDIKNLTITQAVVIGLCQSLAIVPGVSRSGAVIVAGLLMGYKREEAALYSFLLAVPTVLAAGGLDLIRTDWQIITSNIGLTLLGFVVSYLTALLVIKWLIEYLQKKDLTIFGFYRIILGLLLLLTIF